MKVGFLNTVLISFSKHCLDYFHSSYYSEEDLYLRDEKVEEIYLPAWTSFTQHQLENFVQRQLRQNKVYLLARAVVVAVGRR